MINEYEKLVKHLIIDNEEIELDWYNDRACYFTLLLIKLPNDTGEVPRNEFEELFVRVKNKLLQATNRDSLKIQLKVIDLNSQKPIGLYINYIPDECYSGFSTRIDLDIKQTSELIKNKIQCDIEKQKKLEKIKQIKQDAYNQLINYFSTGDK